MRIKIIVEPRPEGGWQVQYQQTEGTPLADPTGTSFCRWLAKDGATDLPIPPPDEQPAPPAPTGLRAQLARIEAQQPQGNDMSEVGRYLFDCLIGVQVWKLIEAAAAHAAIELALCWDVEQATFTRLPWELLARPDDNDPSKTIFLAANPQPVALTRRVRGAPAPTLKLSTPPRVLFVVGSDLDDERISAGIEYLGLLRTLKASGKQLRLDHQLLINASPKRLQEAVKQFQPELIHLICHGRRDDLTNSVKLELRPDDSSESKALIDAAQLLDLLKDSPVQIAVINACDSAAFPSPLSLASALVFGHQGQHIPIVVGMGGTITDQACRLFTRRFYEALLDHGDVAQATAHGRRLALTSRTSSEWINSLDWALPTLFLSEDADGSTIPLAADPYREKRQEWAKNIFDPDFPVFCGREGFFAAYRDLLTATPHQVALVMRARPPSSEDENDTKPRLGMSWLLAELATTAFRDGHLPILLKLPSESEAPRTPQKLGLKLIKAGRETEEWLNLSNEPRWALFEDCCDWAESKPLPDGFEAFRQQQHALRRAQPNDPKVLATLFWQAALDLLVARQQSEQRPSMRLLLLIDDLDRMGVPEVYDWLFTHLLNKTHLAHQAIRVIIGYVARPEAYATTAIRKALDDWSNDRRVKSLPLQPFQQPEDERAYRQFLFGWKEGPLASSTRQQEQSVMRALREIIKGVPSNFECKDISTAIFILQDPYAKRLDRATDDDLIRAHPLLGGTRS